MSEAIVHPVLASTTVSEQSRDVAASLKEFYDRNHVVISVTGVLLVSLYMNRAIFRRELTRLRFIVEVVSDPAFTDLEGLDYLDD